MLVLFTIVLIDLIGFGLVIPLLPFYAERFGASPDVVTMVLATYSLAQLFAAPVWGRLSDRHGRRPILLVSLAGSAFSYLWLGFATHLWMLFAARALAGLCAGNIAAAQAYVADVTAPENRAKGMGMIGVAFGLGFIIGPAVGGALAGHDPNAPAVSVPAFLGAAMSALAFVGTVFVLKESLPAERRGKPSSRRSRVAAILSAIGRPDLRLLLGLYFLIIFAFAGMETTFALWAARQFGWGPAQVGYVFAYVGVLSAAMQGGLIGRLTTRFGERRVLVAGLAAICIGLAALPVSTVLAALLLSTACLAIGMGMTQPSINALISRQAGAHEQGEVMGVSQSLGSLARILGPAFAGICFANIGRNSPYVAGAVLMAFAVALAVHLARGTAAVAAGYDMAPKTRHAP